MTIKIADLMSDIRTCVVHAGEEEAEVTYRPSAYTPEIEDRLQTAVESRRPSNGIAQWLSGIVIDWDVVDDNGERFPTTIEVMREMPSNFLTAVINAITDDMQSEKETRKNSGAGSPKKASLGRARSGTR